MGKLLVYLSIIFFGFTRKREILRKGKNKMDKKFNRVSYHLGYVSEISLGYYNKYWGLIVGVFFSLKK